MSKKHYTLLALMLKEIPATSQRLLFCEKLVRVLKEDNPRFSESAFRKAANCKINSEGSWVP